MVTPRSIVINGDLGSGKTTVSVALAQRLGVRRISVGDLYRAMAAERGMTALELNRHAELDDTVDGYVDRLQREIARSGEQLVVDSRLAWHFFTNAYKVHLIADPAVAAARVLARPDTEVEAYSSLEETEQRLRERSESERARFLTRYGADKRRLRNYDLVCDTTGVGPDEIVDQVVAVVLGRLAPGVLRQRPPLVLADPARIYPTREVGGAYEDDALAPTPPLRSPRPAALGPPRAAGPICPEPVRLGYADGHFFVLDGHRRLGGALQAGRRLIPAGLVAEGDEPVVGEWSARRYFESRATRSIIDNWYRLYGIRLPLPAHLAPARWQTSRGSGRLARER